jgi:DNA-binding NtrC family response regulator
LAQTNRTYKILYLEDEKVWVDLLDNHLQQINKLPLNERFQVRCQLTHVKTADEFLSKMSTDGDFDLALVDLEINTPGQESKQGSDLLRTLSEKRESLPRVVLTARPWKLTISQAIQYGIQEYYQKDVLIASDAKKIKDVHRARLETFLSAMFNLPSRYDFFTENKRFGLQGDDLNRLNEELIGDSLEMYEVKAKIASAARSDLPVLITGESGTGKEKAAFLIHKLSERGRKNYDWVALNCAEYTSELLRSELFGHVKGAFTGAQADKKGLLEQAHNSTLFLDEVGHADHSFQSALLRALSLGKARKVGSSEEYTFDSRLIAATDRPIFGSENIQASFLNRIAGLKIHIPPLRERKSDIGEAQKTDDQPQKLADRFAEDAAKSKVKVEFTPAAIMSLRAYDWPGNVRELKNVVTAIVTDAINRPNLEGPVEIDAAQVKWQISQSTSSFPQAAATAFDSFAPYTSEGRAYKAVERRFLAKYVHSMHHQISGSERTNPAYEKTAAAIEASVSFVKQRLADYRELFDDGSE